MGGWQVFRPYRSEDATSRGMWLVISENDLDQERPGGYEPD